MIARLEIRSGVFALLNSSDLPLIQQYRWHLQETKYTAYARAFIDGTNKAIYMHRLIAGDIGDKHVDHIDGNGLNNVRANLRVCSNQENSFNRTTPTSSASGYRGVSFLEFCTKNGKKTKRRKPWYIRVQLNGVAVRGGYFSTAEEAARKRDELVKKLHGEFASLNFATNHPLCNPTASVSVQNKSKSRPDRVIEYGGTTMRLSQWARQIGMKRATLARRLDVQGLPFEEAISTPLRYRNARRSQVAQMEQERGLRTID